MCKLRLKCQIKKKCLYESRTRYRVPWDTSWWYPPGDYPLETNWKLAQTRIHDPNRLGCSLRGYHLTPRCGWYWNTQELLFSNISDRVINDEKSCRSVGVQTANKGTICNLSGEALPNSGKVLLPSELQSKSRKKRSVPPDSCVRQKTISLGRCGQQWSTVWWWMSIFVLNVNDELNWIQ